MQEPMYSLSRQLDDWGSEYFWIVGSVSIRLHSA